MKIIEIVQTVFKTENTLGEKLGSFFGVAGGAGISIAAYTEAYIWFRTICFMVLGTFITFFMPKVWKFLYLKAKDYAKKKGA